VGLDRPGLLSAKPLKHRPRATWELGFGGSGPGQQGPSWVEGPGKGKLTCGWGCCCCCLTSSGSSEARANCCTSCLSCRSSEACSCTRARTCNSSRSRPSVACSQRSLCPRRHVTSACRSATLARATVSGVRSNAPWERHPRDPPTLCALWGSPLLQLLLALGIILLGDRGTGCQATGLIPLGGPQTQGIRAGQAFSQEELQVLQCDGARL
jgi:hypothetical protein